MLSDEYSNLENMLQHGASLDQVNPAYRIKFVAEEVIRKRKVRAGDDERVKKDNGQDAFMDSLARCIL